MARRISLAQFNIFQAKQKLSHLLRRIEAGEEIIICRNGRPIARLIPETELDPLRRPGRALGLLEIRPYFDSKARKAMP